MQGHLIWFHLRLQQIRIGLTGNSSFQSEKKNDNAAVPYVSLSENGSHHFDRLTFFSLSRAFPMLTSAALFMLANLLSEYIYELKAQKKVKKCFFLQIGAQVFTALDYGGLWWQGF